jgi:hypothetical protein
VYYRNSGVIVLYSNKQNRFLSINSVNNFVTGTGALPNTSYRTKSNPTALSKWICVSAHYIGGKSILYCNGVKVNNHGDPTPGSGNFSIGSSGVFNLGHFQITKNRILSEKDIKLYHKVLITRFNIDADDIAF